MPLYELFCLTRPRLGKSVLGDIIKLAGRKILDNGGVITDIKSFGEQKLAYEIRRPGEKYDEAAMWQVTFAANPKVLDDIDHSLRIDERVLRWKMLKRRHVAALPNPYKVARAAEAVAQQEPQ